MATEEDAQSPGGGENLAAVAILVELLLLALAFVIGRILERVRFIWMGEAGAALLLGLVTGLLLRVARVGSKLATAVAFKGSIFFYVLLPTIMFDAGYGLDTRMFIRNIGSISLYAFAGTAISCFTIGLMMWGFGAWGWCYKLTLLENLTFGALISATDPVTVLAVFNRLAVQPDLYINVFGESVLNDAVGMVLFNVLSGFLGGKDVTVGSAFAGMGMFVAIFVGSALMGLAVGLLAALIFRSQFFYASGGPQHGGGGGGEHGAAGGGDDHGGSTFEVGCAVVFAYASYLIADVAHCSGIVAVVVNGMVMNMYVKPNLSRAAAHKIETLFKVLSGLFELFVFIYIGTTMFLVPEKFNIMGYTGLSLVALAVSRALNVFPLSALVNWLRPVERAVPAKQQAMMWWSGLRGAMAFALAVEAAEKHGTPGEVIKTCTIYLVFITVLFNGGTSAYLIQRLKLRAEDSPAPLLPPAVRRSGGVGGADARGDDGGGGADAEDGGTPGAGADTDTDLSRHGDYRTPGSGGPPSIAMLANGTPHGRSSSAPSRALAAGKSKVGTSFVNRVRQLNDGRLVDKFERFERAVAKVLIHPDALKEAQQQEAEMVPLAHAYAPHSLLAVADKEDEEDGYASGSSAGLGPRRGAGAGRGGALARQATGTGADTPSDYFSVQDSSPSTRSLASNYNATTGASPTGGGARGQQQPLPYRGSPLLRSSSGQLAQQQQQLQGAPAVGLGGGPSGDARRSAGGDFPPPPPQPASPRAHATAAGAAAPL